MADAQVVLRNRSRYKPFQFTLYHAVVCQREARCFCGRTAKMGTDERGESVRAEQSVFIEPRSESKPLPRSVLEIPQVKVALAESPPFLEIANKLADVRVIRASK